MASETCHRCCKAVTGPTYSVEYGTMTYLGRDRGCFMHACCPPCLLAWLAEIAAKRPWEKLFIEPNREWKEAS